LKELSSKPAVDDELAKLKGEIGAGDAPAPVAAIPVESGSAPEAAPGGADAAPSGDSAS
jgi:hypothetical protein